MNSEARKKFNDSFEQEKYQKMLAEIQQDFPESLDFRIAETPVFIDTALKIKLLKAGNEIVNSILKDDFRSKTERAIPENHFVPNENLRPDCLAVDFALCKSETGSLEPKLIELQAFPSLFAYQSYLSGKYKKHFDIDAGYSSYFNRLNNFSYIEELRKWILDGHKPENVILLELYPHKQKTRLDFEISRAYWGIEAVCITKLIQEGANIFYEKEGNRIQVQRIYNRLIFDDLDQNLGQVKLKVNFKEPWNLTWISHPNWFYRVSKFCIPFLKSESIPETKFLSEYNPKLDHLEDFVLKPLFSFAGKGVNIHPTQNDIDGINDPQNYILQKKVQYDPCIKNPEGVNIKAEIRLLYIWPKGLSKPKLVTNLARLSRGEMIGVAFNKDFDWVGGSSAFFETK
jgi:hypothetical protein